MDDDKTKKDGTASAMRSKELFEVSDAWGNPLIYFHNKDYARECKVTLQDGDKIRRKAVKAAASEKTGQFQALTSFQLRSAGPDGIDDGGGEDDIVSWK